MVLHRDHESGARGRGARRVRVDVESAVLAWVILVVGAIPILGLALLGKADPSELAIGTLLVGLAVRDLAGLYLAGPVRRIARRLPRLHVRPERS